MSGTLGSISIRAVNYLDVQALRREVLRAGMIDQTVNFDGDDDPTTMHLGAFTDAGVNIGVSTWLQRPFPSEPQLRGLQLRGMATAVLVQGHGIGGLLLHAGMEYAAAIGVDLIWANARDSALAFYNRHGYSTVGDGFIETVTQLPNHQVVAYLEQ